MELPDLGQHCSESNCKQLNFLPLQCSCKALFCQNHFSKHSLSCTSVTNEIKTREGVKADYICAHNGCGSRSYVPLICQNCKTHFCIAHRHLTTCQEKAPEVMAAELEKYTAPIKAFNDAKLIIDQQLNKSIEEAKKKEKSQKLANKVQLMRIKNKATGLKTIPIVDRIYFNIHSPNNPACSMFIAKNWSLGRAIDAIACEKKLINNNNQTNTLKLRLFRKTSGKIISTDLTDKLEELLSNGIIVEGEDLILEYVNNDCTILT